MPLFIHWLFRGVVWLTWQRLIRVLFISIPGPSTWKTRPELVARGLGVMGEGLARWVRAWADSLSSCVAWRTRLHLSGATCGKAAVAQSWAQSALQMIEYRY